MKPDPQRTFVVKYREAGPMQLNPLAVECIAMKCAADELTLTLPDGSETKIDMHSLLWFWVDNT